MITAIVWSVFAFGYFGLRVITKPPFNDDALVSGIISVLALISAAVLTTIVVNRG